MEKELLKIWTDQRCQRLRTQLELQQYQYFNGRPVWTSVEQKHLKLFMAYTYFGYPFDENEEPNEDIDDLFSYYSNEQKKLILDMCHIIRTKIIKRSIYNIEVGITITHSVCITTNCDVCKHFPDRDIHQWHLIRIKLNPTNVRYIDLHHKRTYNSWTDYIKNNTLPKGILFCSKSGYYEESDYLNCYLTPSSKTSKQILNVLDVFGKVTTFSSGILFVSGLVFPVMAPVLIPASITLGSVSAYDAGRKIYELTDLMKHNQSLVSKEASLLWFELGISAFGVVTAPMTAALKTLQLSESTLLASRIGKSLTILQRSACFAQCSLEAIRLSLIIKQDKLSKTDFMRLRLDLFIVLGSLIPITFFQKLLEHVVSVVPLKQTVEMIKQIPYCVGQVLFTSVNYFGRHVAEFTASALKFLRSQLTPQKMLSAWTAFQRFLGMYRDMVSRLGPEDRLKNVAHNVVGPDELPGPPRSGRPDAQVWEAELRAALCGPAMCDLLRKLGVEPTDLAAVRFCAARVAAAAAAVAAERDDVADTVAANHERPVDAAAVDREFRRVYKVDGWREDVDGGGEDADGRVAAAWYALYGVQKVAEDVPGFWAAYREHQSLPENGLSEQLVVDWKSGRSSGLRVFETTAPPGAVDQDTAVGFARSLDPANPDGYRDYRHFADPHVPGVRLLWRASALSLRLAVFSVQPPRPDGSSSMHVSICWSGMK